jgi:hypothetical protein
VYLIVSAFAFLTIGQISLSERADCELFYISHVVRNGPSSEYDRQKEHPRWKDLCLSEFSPTNSFLPNHQRAGVTEHDIPEETPKKMTPQDKLSNRIIRMF